MRWQEVITSDPAILQGKACFRATRIPVEVVLANLAAGLDEAAIRNSYPTLPPDAIRAALAYAAELAGERVIELPA